MSQSTQSPAGQISDDGHWIWNGAEWVPNKSANQPQPPKKSGTGKKILIGGAAALALLVGIGMVGGSEDESASSGSSISADASDSKPKAEAPAAADADSDALGIGDKAADGKFTFVVTGVRDGGTTIGDDFLSTDAQGRFVLVDVTVKNTGDEAQTMFGDDNVLLDSRGREFSFDSEAALYLDQDAWMEEINPGNSTSATMVFDVPKNVDPTQIRLHDSMFSNGVTVDLS